MSDEDEDTPEELNEERITNLMRELDECKALLAESQATVERLSAELADALGEDP